MKYKLFYLAGYILYWFIYGLFFKGVFLMYHSALVSDLDWATKAGIFFNGARMDLSFAAALSVFPFLILFLSPQPFVRRWMKKSLRLYTTLAVFIATFICTTDLELFRIWGFRLDSTPLMYLNTPTEMIISLGSSPLLFLIILNAIINLYYNFAYKNTLELILHKIHASGPFALGYFFAAAFLLAVLVWGGIQAGPLQIKNVYFSPSLFANQAAVNVPWNLFSSFSMQDSEENPYRFLKAETADSLVKQLHIKGDSARVYRLSQPRPNVVLIIWESLTAKAVSKLGGKSGVTPQFNTLSSEGLLFTQMYASGDRSDKGIVALLSGFPSQPDGSIINHPKKIKKLPNLAKTLHKNGYATSFYYGGDLEFANLRSYLQSGGFEKLIGIEDFPDLPQRSKWGAHDEDVFTRLLEDIDSSEDPRPFFKTVFTLSSHEPFDIPGDRHFPGKNTSDMFLSALHYTDDAVATFIDQARTRDWFKNTLFIIVADHGHTYPFQSRIYEPAKYHIPMLWLGGALVGRNEFFDAPLSQTDLAATLLGQLSIDSQDYHWSIDAFHTAAPHFATYFFKDGVGFITDSSYLSFDNVGGRIIDQRGVSGSMQLELAKAYLQKSYGDYLNK